MGRAVPRQCMHNAVLDLTPIVPTTAYHRRSYAERYSGDTQLLLYFWKSDSGILQR
jgi:hypothetical protein